MYTKHLSVTLFPTCRHSGITLGWTPGSTYIKTIYNSQTVQVEKKKKKKAGRRQPFLKLEDCLAHCWDTWDIPLWQATLRRVLQKFNRRQGTVTGLGGLCMHPLPNSSGIRGMEKQFSKKAICTGLIFLQKLLTELTFQQLLVLCLLPKSLADFQTFLSDIFRKHPTFKILNRWFCLFVFLDYLPTMESFGE